MSLRSCCEQLCKFIDAALSVTVEYTSQGGTKVDIDLRVQIVDMFCQFFGILVPVFIVDTLVFFL